MKRQVPNPELEMCCGIGHIFSPFKRWVAVALILAGDEERQFEGSRLCFQLQNLELRVLGTGNS